LRSSLRYAARCSCLAVALLFALGGSTAAPGTFPGKNGPIVFDGIDNNTHTIQIWRMGANGTAVTQITSTNGALYNECPSVSANGQLIYVDSFDRASANSAPHVYRMNLDGSGRQLADRPTAPSHLCPAAGPGGKAITSMQYPNKGSGGSVIIRMNGNGTARKTIARAAPRQDNYGPTYSPNGKQILFNRVTYKAHVGFVSADLFISNGRRNTNITARDDQRYFTPSWAPNGQSILATRGIKVSQLVRMNPDGSDVRVLYTAPNGIDLGAPNYSPDGTKIAFFACQGECGDPLTPDTGVGSIWVMNADGSNPTPILVQSATTFPLVGALVWATASS